VLKRDQSNYQGKGYFFLAIVFGMMCCSSYAVNNQPDSLTTAQQELTSRPSILQGALSPKSFNSGKLLKSHIEGGSDIERKF